MATDFHRSLRQISSAEKGFHEFENPQKLRSDDRRIGFRSAIAEKLPDIADFANHVQIHISHDDVILGSFDALRYKLAARIAEVTLAVELAYPPGVFITWTIDRAHEELVGYGVRRLLDSPQILAQPGDSR
jgi:hypothetical protein